MNRLSKRSLVKLVGWGSLAVLASLAGCSKEEKTTTTSAPAGTTTTTTTTTTMAASAPAMAASGPIACRIIAATPFPTLCPRPTSTLETR